MFGDLTSAGGLKKLNDYLFDKSYIKGTQPSQADVSVFADIKSLPTAELVNCLRWYNHIKSYGDDKKKFPVDGAESKEEDDFELFGSDGEEEIDAEAEKVRQERIDAYTAKKSTKKAITAKSNIVLDVKPWDDETDMQQLEKCVRSVHCDGLLWGASKLVPLAYGIKKLQITCVVEDEKVGTDFLEEQITAFEDFIQSVDIAAFNKI